MSTTNPKPTTFRLLPIGQTFEFYHGTPPHMVLAGVWRKVSARCYVLASDGEPTTGKVSGARYQVGTITVGVMPGR